VKLTVETAGDHEFHIEGSINPTHLSPFDLKLRQGDKEVIPQYWSRKSILNRGVNAEFFPEQKNI
jgi:hypothetical protein